MNTNTVVGKPERERIFQKHRPIEENNIKKDLMETADDSMHWINVTEGIVGTFRAKMNLGIPWKEESFWLVQRLLAPQQLWSLTLKSELHRNIPTSF
jgi:hypothetical protein